jgi:hypothetical protein
MKFLILSIALSLAIGCSYTPPRETGPITVIDHNGKEYRDLKFYTRGKGEDKQFVAFTTKEGKYLVFSGNFTMLEQ